MTSPSESRSKACPRVEGQNSPSMARIHLKKKSTENFFKRNSNEGVKNKSSTFDWHSALCGGGTVVALLVALDRPRLAPPGAVGAHCTGRDQLEDIALCRRGPNHRAHRNTETKGRMSDRFRLRADRPGLHSSSRRRPHSAGQASTPSGTRLPVAPRPCLSRLTPAIDLTPSQANSHPSVIISVFFSSFFSRRAHRDFLPLPPLRIRSANATGREARPHVIMTVVSPRWPRGAALKIGERSREGAREEEVWPSRCVAQPGRSRRPSGRLGSPRPPHRP